MNQNKKLSDFNLVKYGYPDKNGHYGVFGGTFVAETLIEPLTKFRNMYYKLKKDEENLKELTIEYENKILRIFRLPSIFDNFCLFGTIHQNIKIP